MRSSLVGVVVVSIDDGAAVHTRPNRRRECLPPRLRADYASPSQRRLTTPLSCGSELKRSRSSTSRAKLRRLPTTKRSTSDRVVEHNPHSFRAGLAGGAGRHNSRHAYPDSSETAFRTGEETLGRARVGGYTRFCARSVRLQMTVFGAAESTIAVCSAAGVSVWGELQDSAQQRLQPFRVTDQDVVGG